MAARRTALGINNRRPCLRLERDGKLSDMVNFSRAKDAALSLADRAIRECLMSTAETVPMRRKRNPVPDTVRGKTLQGSRGGLPLCEVE
jgi:hypothetical protein